jgi:hypothetical protein
MTAVKAPPTASVRGGRPAMFSAARSVIPTVPRRIRKPTVPAVPGSRRRNRAGPAARPTSRAIVQPSTTSARTVNTRIGMSRPASLWR